jgi:hypothetical protein
MKKDKRHVKKKGWGKRMKGLLLRPGHHEELLGKAIVAGSLINFRYLFNRHGGGPA